MAKDIYHKFITPLGTAKFPWLTKADTKFNPDGVYKTDLILSSDEAKPIATALKEHFAKHYPKTKGKMPYAKEKDADGKETGDYVFKFKTKNKPALFDGAGKPIQNVNVFGGSKIIVSATAAPYSTGGNTGVTLYLNAVQVVELVSGDSNGGQQSFGFVAQENAYQHSEEIEEAFNTEETSATTETDEDDF
jgi:hypothetical protein